MITSVLEAMFSKMVALRNSSRRKSRGKASWKTGGEAGIGLQSEDVKAPEDKKEEQSEASKEGAVPSDVLGMFGGEDEDD